jgi:hypothetical protein
MLWMGGEGRDQFGVRKPREAECGALARVARLLANPNPFACEGCGSGCMMIP